MEPLEHHRHQQTDQQTEQQSDPVREQSKRRKKNSGTVQPSDSGTICQYWIPQKNRYCKFPPLAGKQFCGNHTKDDRVPCPVDTTHSVRILDLKKHVLVCHKTKDEVFVRHQPLYHLNINRRVNLKTSEDFNHDVKRLPDGNLSLEGYDLDIETLPVLEEKIHSAFNTLIKLAKQNNIQIQQDYPEITTDQINHYRSQMTDGLNNDDDEDVDEEVDESQSVNLKKLPGEAISPQNLTVNPQKQPVSNESKEDLLQGRVKHQIQNDLIYQQMMTLECTRSIGDVGMCVAEFGCGKGGLAGRLMDESFAKTWKFLLVERETRRGKVEHAKKFAELESVRLRLDIKDTDLQWLNGRVDISDEGPIADTLSEQPQPELSTEAQSSSSMFDLPPIFSKSKTDVTSPVFTEPITHMLVCAKHLCGVATDLSLSAVERSTVPTSLCVATCCHHACDWKEFVGREIFEEIGLCEDEKQFMALRLITSWACSKVKSFPESRKQIGRMMKSLFDLARSLWIMKHLQVKNLRFTAFVDPLVSPENFLILAD